MRRKKNNQPFLVRQFNFPRIFFFASKWLEGHCRRHVWENTQHTSCANPKGLRTSCGFCVGAALLCTVLWSHSQRLQGNSAGKMQMWALRGHSNHCRQVLFFLFNFLLLLLKYSWFRCCPSLCCTSQWLSYIHICTLFFSFLIYLFWLRWVFVAICGLSLVAVRERTRIDDSGLAVLG